MKKPSRALLTVAAAATLGLGLAACSTGPAEEGAADSPLTLVLVPSQEVDQLTEDGDVLAGMLSDELGRDVEIEVVDSYNAAVIAMQSGDAQIGMFGPIALVQAADQAGAVPILQSVRYGSSTYVTQWMTNDPARFCLDEPVDVDGFLFCNGTDSAEGGPVGEDAVALITADDSISFVDEGSASGYYYPATQLGEAGLDIDALSGSFFAGGHPQSVQAVLDGQATVGVSFNDAREDIAEENPDSNVGQEVVVFAWSADIPNDGIAVASDLSEEDQQAIKDAFMAIAETEDGLAVLDAVYNIDGFADADLDALDAARQVEENFGEE